jgi:hypothetical protein
LIDLVQTAEEHRKLQALTLAAEAARRPSRPSELPFRATLLRLSDTEYWLILVSNEIAVDAESLRLLLRELPLLYASSSSQAPHGLPAVSGRYLELAQTSLDPDSG